MKFGKLHESLYVIVSLLKKGSDIDVHGFHGCCHLQEYQLNFS